MISTPALIAVPPMLVEPVRGGTTTQRQLMSCAKRDLSVAQIAAQSPSMKLQHVEVLVKTIYMQLSEKIGSQWEGDWRSHRKTPELWEPLLLWPKRSHQGEESTPAGPKLVQNTANQSEWQKRVSLEPVPRLEKSICPYRHRIVQGGKIHGKTIVEGGGKKINHHRPPLPQLVDHFLR